MEITLYDRDNYIDEDLFAEEYEAEFGQALSPEEALARMSDQDAIDFEDEVLNIDARLDGLDPGGRILARGSMSRWNGTSSGYTDLYDSFSDLVRDTGYDGLFKDCEIDRIWDEDGSLYVRGVHHDGSVTVELRQLSPALADRFQDFVEGCAPDGESIDAIWDGAQKPSMAQYYGISVSGSTTRPACSERPAPAAAAAAARRSAERGAGLGEGPASAAARRRP